MLRRTPGAGPAARAALAVVLAAACRSGERGPAPVFLSIGTAGTGGIYYPLGGALAGALSVRDSMRQYTAEVTGGSVENVNRLREGQIDLGMAIAITVYQAYNGEGDYRERPVRNLRIVAPLYPNRTHVVVPRGSEARSPADFRGARISVGSAGSGTEQLSRQLLAVYGLTYDDVDERYLTFTESSSALRDHAIDAAILSVGYPAAAVLEATSVGGARLLPVDQEHARELIRLHPYYSAGSIPAGVYPGVDEEIPTVSLMNWIVAREDLDAEVVEAVLAVLTDGRRELVRVHDMARQIDLNALESPPIPLHPATRRWLERHATSGTPGLPRAVVLQRKEGTPCLSGCGGRRSRADPAPEHRGGRSRTSRSSPEIQTEGRHR